LRGMKKDQEIIDSANTIAADTFLKSNAYKKFVNYRNIVQRINDNKKVNPDSLIINNPEYYNAYVIAGDYSFKNKQFSKALSFYKIALTKVIATKQEEAAIGQKINECNKKIDR